MSGCAQIGRASSPPLYSRPVLRSGARLDGDEGLEIDTNYARGLARALAPAAREREASLFEIVPLDADLEGVFRYLVQR